MVFLRSLVFSLGYFVLTISYGSISLATWVLPSLVRHKIVSSWTTVVINWLRFACGVRYEVIGRKRIASTNQPFVILSKHQSAWETLYLQSLFWPAATVLKKELLDIPFFGWGLRAMNPIAIDRSNPRKALRQVKEKGLHRLERGLNLILFPEGTRMAPGQKGSYARSGADIAIKARKEIVPVALNAAKCWPSKSFKKYPGLITVSIGSPITTANKTSKEIMKEVEQWIETEMTRIEAEG